MHRREKHTLGRPPFRGRERALVSKRMLSEEEYRECRATLGHLLLQRRVDPVRRQSLCRAIASEVISKSPVMDSMNFTRTTNGDLAWMAELYDQAFMDGYCLRLARHFGIQFRWSKRMTSNGGKTVRIAGRDLKTGRPYVRYEIVLSATLLFQTFGDLKRPVRVSGVLCNNRTEAMQRVVEHELVHLAEMLVWDDSCCAAPRFQSIAGRLFGHTEHKHELITQQERAERKFNVRVGSLVEFTMNGKTYVGTVNRITRRATVLVPNARGQLYDDGRRYAKYYVPLSHLRLHTRGHSNNQH